ncbi:hypothetical protein T01_8399 [Trichinella spiralis]|uniref:Uncharacterized protein n=1 Tax=Trichinella spiralis TaxID=6334 RepID=A0A0V1AR36_TRISP|nr:hypothetical protein T01_8399 [Trichinella spiralis]
MVTRGRKKLMEASVREAGHHGGESASTVDVAVVESKKITGKTARRTRRAPSLRNLRGITGSRFGHASPKTSPSSPTTTATSNRPRTPSISKRGARSELPYTPAFITPSTSGGSGKQRVLVSLLLRTVELHDLEVFQITEEQVTVRAVFPIAQAVVCH